MEKIGLTKEVEIQNHFVSFKTQSRDIGWNYIALQYEAEDVSSALSMHP